MSTLEPVITARREYRMKAWYRSLLLVMGAAAVSGGTVMGILSSRAVSPGLLIIMALLFLGFGIYLFALAIRSRVVIDGTRLEIHGAFTDHAADFHEIEGYRTVSSRNGKYTQIYLNNGRGTLTLSNFFDHDEAFEAWFDSIANLDRRDRDALLEKISQEQELGSTPQERLSALSQARTNSIFALVIALAAAVAANWGIPSLEIPFSIALALVPIVLAFLLHRSPLLYTVFRRKEDPRAELVYALIVTSFGLLIRARGIRFVSFQSVGLVMAILAVAYIGAFYHSFFESSSPMRTFFALLLFGMLYSYGVVAVADAVGDDSAPTRYAVHVLSKHYTTGRSRSFYLVLEPWGPLHRPNNLGVSKTIYDQARSGDRVCLDLRSGRLGVPWYTQVSCSDTPLDSQP